jgi:hypothetical protein
MQGSLKRDIPQCRFRAPTFSTNCNSTRTAAQYRTCRAGARRPIISKPWKKGCCGRGRTLSRGTELGADRSFCLRPVWRAVRGVAVWRGSRETLQLRALLSMSLGSNAGMGIVPALPNSPRGHTAYSGFPRESSCVGRSYNQNQ